LTASTEVFPRGTGLPTQSSLFWVQQKDRQLLIRDIEKITKRRLIVYFANRYLINSDINIGDISQLTELLGDLNGAPTDLLLNTGGGQTDATEAVVSLLQTTIKDFRVIVPHSAKSNGTMICLAAREIVMGPSSELGPIDPYLGENPASILADPIVKSQNFPLHQLALYAIDQTKKLATRLLSSGMMKGSSPDEVHQTVQKLASRDEFFSHGSVIDHAEAKNLGLNVVLLPFGDEVWERVWLLYCMYAHDAGASNLVKIFEGRARSMSIRPANIP
jgi:hypothetical protein